MIECHQNTWKRDRYVMRIFYRRKVVSLCGMAKRSWLERPVPISQSAPILSSDSSSERLSHEQSTDKSSDRWEPGRDKTMATCALLLYHVSRSASMPGDRPSSDRSLAYHPLTETIQDNPTKLYDILIPKDDLSPDCEFVRGKD